MDPPSGLEPPTKILQGPDGKPKRNAQNKTIEAPRRPGYRGVGMKGGWGKGGGRETVRGRCRQRNKVVRS